MYSPSVMYIKQVKKRNRGYEKEFRYYRLVESYRTPRGPRQRNVLNLGKLEGLPKEKHKLLADRIEDKVYGRENELLEPDEDVERLAEHFAGIIIDKQLAESRVIDPSSQQPDYEEVDLRSLKNSKSRTVGTEYLGVEFFRRLGLDGVLRGLGFSRRQVNRAILSVVGRLVHSASEHSTRRWARSVSAIGELVGEDFRHLSNNALYRISDRLLEHRDEIERHLRARERDLYSLDEKIILFDLTNTFFEGTQPLNPKALHGRSKERRNDRPLVTLGLVVDELGFAKGSRVFRGNVSEPKTLISFLQMLRDTYGGGDQQVTSPTAGATVVMDAGLATDENIDLLKSEGYNYIVVSRRKPQHQPPEEGLVRIKGGEGDLVEACLHRSEGEALLYCRSDLRTNKEQAMMGRFQKRFEEELISIEQSLHRKGGVKSYDKVLKRIGRAMERNSRIAHFYRVDVKEKDGRAVALDWSLERYTDAKRRFSGSYYLRTNRTDLDEKQIWELYSTLTRIEDAFRTLKTELNLRPVYHFKEKRVEGHIFITMLAYHLLTCIQHELRRKGIRIRWSKLRMMLCTQTRVTTSMNTKDGRKIHIRSTTDPEPFHRRIYGALNMKTKPLTTKQTKT